MLRVGVEQPGVRVVSGVRPVFGTAHAGPHLDGCTTAQFFAEIRFNRAARGHVHVRRPIDTAERLGGNQFAVGAVDHVEETVTVHLHHHLALDAVHVHVGEDQFPQRIPVEGIIRHKLIVPDDFTGFGFDRDHCRRIQVIALAVRRIPWPGVTRAPIHQIKFGIIRAGDPGAGTAGFVRLARLPGVVPLFAGARGGVAPPQFLAGLGIPAVEKAADAKLGTRDAGDQHAVGDQRRHGHRITFFPLSGLLPPELLAGFLIECDHVRIKRGAKHLALVERDTFVRHAAAHHAAGFGYPRHRRAPELLAGERVDGVGPARIGDIHHAVVNHRLRLLAKIVVEARRPYRRKFPDVVPVNLPQRAVAILVVAHAVGQHIVGTGLVADQLGVGGADTGPGGFGHGAEVVGGTGGQQCKYGGTRQEFEFHHFP